MQTKDRNQFMLPVVLGLGTLAIVTGLLGPVPVSPRRRRRRQPIW